MHLHADQLGFEDIQSNTRAPAQLAILFEDSPVPCSQTYTAVYQTAYMWSSFTYIQVLASRYLVSQQGTRWWPAKWLEVNAFPLAFAEAKCVFVDLGDESKGSCIIRKV